jgi:hypothetical protein
MNARAILMFSLAAAVSACGGDDSGECTDAACMPQVTLTVTKEGGGQIISAPAGIDCGTTCTMTFAMGSQVSLVATPSFGSAFDDWSGACDAVTGTFCALTLTADTTVGATFVLACEDECPNTGDTQCSGTDAEQVCGESDTDPCLEWGAPVACEGGETCVGNACTPPV